MMTSLLIQPARDPVVLHGDPIQRWVQPDDADWAFCHRSASGYVIRFPDYADFEISSDASTIVCYPVAATEPNIIEHLYLNHVRPMALGRQGQLAFHGCAIEISSRAVAFMGQSGRGKSTLAFSFAANGYRFLADDGLVIDDVADEITVAPNHPSIRLLDDSRRALSAPDADAVKALSYSAKCRIDASDKVCFCDRSRPLSGVYFLGEGNVRKIQIRRIKAADALINWVKHSFVLDVEDKVLVSRHFDRLSNLVTKIPSYSLDFPRRFDQLAHVRLAIADHAKPD